MAADKKTLLANALKFVQKGQIDKAIDAYKAVVKEDPKDVKTRNTLGDLYLKVGKKKEAVAEFLEAVNLHEKDGFANRAVAMGMKILGVDPEMIAVRIRVGDLSASLKLTAEARQQYLLVANHYEKKGDIKAALEVFRKIADLEPQNLAARIKLAGMFEKQKFPEKAADEYICAARGFKDKGDANAAAQLYARAFKLAPAKLESRRGLAEHHAQKKDWPVVIGVLQPMAKKGTLEPGLVVLYAGALVQVRHPREAVEALEKALEKEPSSIPLNQCLGRALISAGDVEKGVAALNRCITGLLGENRYDIADALLLEMAAAAPEDHRVALRAVEVAQKRGEPAPLALAYRNLAGIYEKKGLVPDAMGALEKLLEQQPGDAEATGKLAALKDLAPPPKVAPPPPAAPPPPVTPPPPPPSARPAAPPAAAPPVPPVAKRPVAPAEEEEEGITEYDLGAGLAGVGEDEEFEIEVEGEEEPRPAAPEPASLDDIPGLLDRSQFDKAAAFLASYLKAHPEEEEAHRLLAETRLRKGDRNGARDAFVQLAELCFRNDRLEEAQAAYQEVLGIDPRYRPAAIALGKIAVEEERRRLQAAAPPPAPVPAPAPAPVEPVPLAPAPAPAEEIPLDIFEEPAPPPEDLIELPIEPEPVAVAAMEPPAPPEPQVVPEEAVEPQPVPEPLPEADELTLAEELPPVPESPASPDELSLGFGEVAAPEEVALAPEPPPVAETPPAEAPAPEESFAPGEPDASAPQFWGMEDMVETPVPAAGAAAEAPPSTPLDLPLGTEEFSLEGFGEGGGGIGAAATPAPPAEKISMPETGTGTGEVDEFLAEANFYFQQGLLDEAEFLYNKLIKLAPGHPEIAGQLKRLGEVRSASLGGGLAEAGLSDDAWGAALEPAAPAAAEPPAGGGTLDLDGDLDRAFGAAVPAAAPGAAPAEEPPLGELPPDFGEAISAGAGDFSDFLSGLRQELSAEVTPAAAPAAEPEGLTEIFQEFQRHVKDQLGEEDFETHYNLGIAYKEMGLMEEALGEFSLSERSPVRQVDSVSMIALCLREMGRTEEAVKKLEEGLVSAREGSEEQKGLLYDLGSAYEQVGREAEAQETYRRLVYLDPAYRDVSSRVNASPAPAATPEAAPDTAAAPPPRKKPKVSFL
jgi:tetratricopeptide (TPR) repeat protein